MHPANFDYHRANSIDEAESLYKAKRGRQFPCGGAQSDPGHETAASRAWYACGYCRH
jgi:hypothetical protein